MKLGPACSNFWQVSGSDRMAPTPGWPVRMRVVCVCVCFFFLGGGGQHMGGDTAPRATLQLPTPREASVAELTCAPLVAAC
jgi:hypothetical protein